MIDQRLDQLRREARRRTKSLRKQLAAWTMRLLLAVAVVELVALAAWWSQRELRGKHE